MTDLNHVVLTGNIVHDIGERDKTKVGETTKLTVTIANNQSVKVSGEWKNVAYFFDIEMWGKLADNLEPYLVKGKGLAVEGHLKVDRWEKDGQKKSKTYVVADTVKLLGGKTDDSANAQLKFVPTSANAQKTTSTEQNDLGFKEDPVF